MRERQDARGCAVGAQGCEREGPLIREGMNGKPAISKKRKKRDFSLFTERGSPFYVHPQLLSSFIATHHPTTATLPRCKIIGLD